MTAIIFGSNGQDGYYLTKELIARGINVIGYSRNGDHKLDIKDPEEVKKIVSKYLPEFIFHLAANSTTRHNALFDNHDTISTGTINILEAVKQRSPKTKLFLSGSGLQFVNNGEPINERNEFSPSSAYSVARIHSVFAARYYRTFGLKIYIGYFFNHESPRRTEKHISKSIAEAVKRIADGSNEKIEIGDTSVKKEWTFAKDVVVAILTLVNQETIFEAVIGSGKAYSIKEYIMLCFESIGKDWKEYVIEKQNFKAEYKILVSDPTLIFSLGWRPRVNFNELVQMMIKSLQ